MTDPRMNLTLGDLYVPTPDSVRRRAEIDRKALSWADRADECHALGLKPRLFDMDDLLREVAGLPPDPPLERLDGFVPQGPAERRLAAETAVDVAPIAEPIVLIEELVHAQSGLPLVETLGEPSLSRPVTAGTAKVAGYTGDSCEMCGSFAVRRNGTCTICESCGNTSGCS